MRFTAQFGATITLSDFLCCIKTRKLFYYYEKNLQLFIHITVVLISLHTFAQTEAEPWQVEIGFNAIDVFPTGQSPYGQLFEDFFNVQEHWNISPFLS